MSQLLELVGRYLDKDSVETLSRNIGANSDQTQQAIGAALPTLLGALAQNADNPEGEQNLHQALLKDHDGSLLDNLGAILGGKEESKSTSVTDRPSETRFSRSLT